MSSYAGYSSNSKVKPILKKFAQNEKASLDLDRPSTEQSGAFYLDQAAGSRSILDDAYEPSRRGYHHRSTSNASQFSTATSGSGQRGGTFVHPFQQTPRPYTPTLSQSYHGSFAGGDYLRDNPVVPEEGEHPRYAVRSPSNLSNHSASVNLPQQPLRVQTKPTSSSRLVHGSSQTNLHSSSSFMHTTMTSPTETISSASLMRSSMDKGFRIRSRSDVEGRSREETVREARRKFDEREQMKDEKAAQAAIKAIEKQNQKEARQLEKGRRSTASEGTGTRSKRSKSDLLAHEKGDTFVSRDYNSIPLQTPPQTAEGFEPPRPSRKSTATKRKPAHSAWTSFMMWLRTRFLRIGRSTRKR